MSACRASSLVALGLCLGSAPMLCAQDFEAQRAQLLALGDLTTPPAIMDASGYDAPGALRAIYFDALPWQGKPTKVFAWLGLPENAGAGPVPGVVLVHGGGGTAFTEWVTRWNARGFAAISIAVEGQTNQRAPKQPDERRGGWAPHEWAGPRRDGIYGDSDEALKDQWMYHAVADTVLANSLLRALPEVDADQVGVMGISWGGVIVSTVVGIDDRFAFAIPTYGCGRKYTAANQYGRALADNQLYRKVWDPVLRLGNADLPMLWFSWPEDKHFPLDCQAASYRAAPGPHMVTLIPKLGHGHGPPWKRPESYAFAESVVRGNGPWCRETASSLSERTFAVTFQSDKPLDAATLISTVDDGITGLRDWVASPAELSRQGDQWHATAKLPPATTAWFVNVASGELTVSSEYQERPADVEMASTEDARPPKPNVVLLLTDDLGWQDAKCYDIDHSAFPQPEDQGFDWTRHNRGTTQRMRPHRLTGFATDHPEDRHRLDENGFTTHQNSEDALTFVREHKDKPFFLYYATWLVHTPIHTRNERLLDKYCKKLGVERPANPQEWEGEGQTNPFYCAMVEALDYYAGKLFDYLDATEDPRWPGHRLSENTYILFTSDNGGMERHPGEIITDNYPLDRGKISAMEGGTRVPLIVVGPGIEGGVQSDVMVNGLDFYPTMLSMVGAAKPENKPLDGCDLTRLLFENPQDPTLVREADGSVRDTMIWHFPHSVALESTIRVGDFKLVRNDDHVNNPSSPELEWFRESATLLPDMKAAAHLPEGTTHYFINLIDENNFLGSYPEPIDNVTKNKTQATYSETALRAL